MRRSLVGGCHLDDRRIAARSRPHHQADGHRMGQQRLHVARHGRIARLVRTQQVLRLVHDARVARRNVDFRRSEHRRELRAAARRATVADLGLGGTANPRRRQGVLGIHEGIDAVLVHDLQDDEPQRVLHLQIAHLSGPRAEVLHANGVLRARAMRIVLPLRIRHPGCPVLDPRVAALTQVLVHREWALEVVHAAAEAAEIQLVRQRSLAQGERNRIIRRPDVPAWHREFQLPVAGGLPEVFGDVVRENLANRVVERVLHVGNRGVVLIQRVHRLHQLGPERVAQDRLDFPVDLVRDRLVVLRVLHHELADDPDAQALERLRRHVGVASHEAGVGLLGHERFRDRGVHVLGFEPLHRIEDERHVPHRAAVDPGAIAHALAVHAAVHHEAAGGQEVDHVVAGCGTLAGR